MPRKKKQQNRSSLEEDITKQPWYKEFQLTREIWKKSGGNDFSSCVASSPIPFKLAKKKLFFYDERMISHMVAAVLNKERGELAKTIKYILTLPKNHKHRKNFEKHLPWAIKNGKTAKQKLKKAWDTGDVSQFRHMF